MNHKRLNRDQWGFQYYPYYQMRIDHELFHGTACLIRLTDGEKNYWETPKAGRIQVTGEGMTWLELIPDDTRRVITTMYFPDGTHDPERKHYPVTVDERYQPSIWYIDIIEGIEQDEDGITVFIDKYLDVIITPEGEVKVDDRDELDAAYVLPGNCPKSSMTRRWRRAKPSCRRTAAISADWTHYARRCGSWRRNGSGPESPSLCAGKSGNGERRRENPDTANSPKSLPERQAGIKCILTGDYSCFRLKTGMLTIKQTAAVTAVMARDRVYVPGFSMP